MTKFSEYMKDRKEKDLEFFFGKDIHHTTNKYFTFNRIHDEDNITIITNDVTFIKGSPVLIVGENKAVYLKDWAIKEVHNYDEMINTFAVKLCRKYFKTYTFKSTFTGYTGMKEETFDDLMQIAKEQNEKNMEVACGHMG